MCFIFFQLEEIKSKKQTITILQKARKQPQISKHEKHSITKVRQRFFLSTSFCECVRECFFICELSSHFIISRYHFKGLMVSTWNFFDTFLPLSNFVIQNDTNIPIETSDWNTKTDVNNQRQPNDRWHWHDDTLSGIWQFFFLCFVIFALESVVLDLSLLLLRFASFDFCGFFLDFNRFVFPFLFRLFPDDSISIHTCFSILGI